MKKLLLFGLSFSLSLSGFTIPGNAVHLAAGLKNINLSYAKGTFNVVKDGVACAVKNECLSKSLRNMNPEQIKKLASAGYFVLNQFTSGDYTLDAQYRLKGGGPMLGATLYYGIKGLGYASMMIAAAFIGTASMAAGPGGPAVTGTAIGITTATGGTAAMLAGIEAAAVSAGAWGFLAPTP